MKVWPSSCCRRAGRWRASGHPCNVHALYHRTTKPVGGGATIGTRDSLSIGTERLVQSAGLVNAILCRDARCAALLLVAAVGIIDDIVRGTKYLQNHIHITHVQDEYALLTIEA